MIMKNLLFFISLFAALAFANSDCHDFAFVMTFRDSTIWLRNEMFYSGCYAVVDDTLSETLIDGYKCVKQRDKAEKAYLDSNVFLYRQKESGAYALYVYMVYEISNGKVQSLATHGIGEIFKDEFLHWQQCGMLKLTYEEADSLATSLVEPLNEFFEGKIDVVLTEDFYVDMNPHKMPSQISQWVQETCATEQSPPSDTGTSPNNRESEALESLQWLKYSSAGVVFENGVAHIPNYLRGEKYFVFDINGKVIQKGVAEESVYMLITPAILKIGSKKPFLLK